MIKHNINCPDGTYVVVFLPVSVTLTWNQSSDRRSKPGSSVGNWKFSFSGFNIAAEAIPLVPVKFLKWKIGALLVLGKIDFFDRWTIENLTDLYWLFLPLEKKSKRMYVCIAKTIFFCLEYYIYLG